MGGECLKDPKRKLDPDVVGDRVARFAGKLVGSTSALANARSPASSFFDPEVVHKGSSTLPPTVLPPSLGP